MSASIRELVIIGGGISGMCMALEAKKSGIDYVIIEASNNVGGVWNGAFNTSRLQTHWKNYKFNNYNNSIKLEFPFSGEILEYLNDFNKHNSFNICFNTRVIKCEYDKDRSIWDVETNNKSFKSKYLAVCSGYYSVPREIEGLSRFTGKIINYNKFSKIGLKNRKILIVGNGASCVDVLRYWKETGTIDEIASLDISYTRDKYFLNTFFARLISLFVNKYFLKFLKIIPRWFLIILIYSFCKFNGRIPDEKFSANNVVASGIITQLEKEGKIRYIKSPVACAKGNRVLFTKGVVGEYDIIINKCGFNKNIDFLNIENVDKELGYNFCLINSIPRCAFIGFAPSSNWTRVAEAQSKWWMGIVKGSIEIPDNSERILFYKKYLKNERDTREFNDLTYESFEFVETLLKKCNV